MWNEVCQYLDNWTNYTDSKEHKAIEEKWWENKKEMKLRHARNEAFQEILSMFFVVFLVCMFVLTALG